MIDYLALQSITAAIDALLCTLLWVLHIVINLGPPDISETTRARQLNLNIILDMVNYPLWVQKLLPATKEEVIAFARVHLSVC